MPTIRLALASLLVVVLAHCGGSSGVAPDCSGSSCVCNAGATCDLGGTTCEEKSCSLKCAADTECVGTCGDSCSLDCTSGASCTITVGASASVSCTGGSTCHITCTGSCSVACGGGSTCELTCNGDSGPKPIPEGGKCEK